VLANLLIGLREGLEASLVISILVAYLVKSGRRHLLPRLWLGVGAAVALSLGVGAALTFGPRGITDEQQELIGGTLSVVAVAMVTWMILWMAGAGRTLARQLRERVDAAEGQRWALPLVAALAVGREGLETALFLWAATQAASGAGASTAAPLLGALAGLALAAGLGYLLYRGAVRINLGRFFAWTGGFLVLVAAGVLAYGVHDLQEAGVLPETDAMAYDVSGVLDPNGVPAALLRGVFNLGPSATVAEAAVWVAYVVVVGALFWSRLRAGHRPAPAPATAAGEPAASDRLSGQRLT